MTDLSVPGHGNPADVQRVRPYLGQPWLVDAAQDAGQEPAPTGLAPRPFLLTAGRVVAETDLPMETQVVSTSQGQVRQRTLQFEHRDIVELCVQPLSVAEVAARLRLQLGVVRVLVTDLSAEGALQIHQAPTEVAHDVPILLRVIDGLRAIS